MEEDWVEIDVDFFCCNLYFTLDWDDATVDYDMTIYDESLNPVASAETYNKPETTSVGALIGDIYYVRIRIWRETSSPTNFVLKNYTLKAE